MNKLLNHLWIRSYKLVARLSRRGISEYIDDKIKNETGRALNLGCGNRSFNYPNELNEIRLDIIKRAECIQADAHYLPFKNEMFDVIISSEVFEHLYNPYLVVDEIHRTLKKGGMVLITTRFLFHIHDAPHDFFRFTKYGLEYLFKEFSDIEVIPQHSGYLTILIMLGRFQMEKTNIIRWISLPLAIFVYMFSFLDPIVSKLFPTETVTSGYFIYCKK